MVAQTQSVMLIFRLGSWTLCGEEKKKKGFPVHSKAKKNPNKTRTHVVSYSAKTLLLEGIPVKWN